MIPVTIVTGFLGSGKTTLISRILRDPAYGRTAVIVNEFGEIGLDHDLISNSDDQVLTLNTGCLCCAVQSDLAKTLMDLLQRRASGAIGYDRVLIETSGLSDPAPVLQSMMTDSAVSASHRLPYVVTLVDTIHGEASLRDHVEARHQVALADRILISKTDLIPHRANVDARPVDFPHGTARVAHLFQDAAAMDEPGHDVSSQESASTGASKGRVAEQLSATLDELNAMAPRLTTIQAMPADLFGESSVAALTIRLSRTPRQLRHTTIDTFTVIRDRPLPALALTLLLQAVAEHCGPRLLRLKGLVAIEEMPGRPAVIHGVHHVVSPPDFLARWPSSDERTRIVFITTGVPRYFVSRLLDAIEEEVRDAISIGVSTSNRSDA